MSALLTLLLVLLVSPGHCGILQRRLVVEQSDVAIETPAERREENGAIVEEERERELVAGIAPLARRREGESREEGRRGEEEAVAAREEGEGVVGDVTTEVETQISAQAQTPFPPPPPPPPPHPDGSSAPPLTLLTASPKRPSSTYEAIPPSLSPPVSLRTLAAVDRAALHSPTGEEEPGQDGSETRAGPTLKHQNAHRAKAARMLITMIKPKEGGVAGVVEESASKLKMATFGPESWKSQAGLRNPATQWRENKLAAEVIMHTHTDTTPRENSKLTSQAAHKKNMAVGKKTGKDQRKSTLKRVKEEEEDAEEDNFPFFKDNYCPPECACYGRVVQCSDKGVDTVPYGIPYTTRYVLLMNNRISSIQLDLLSEYESMEFLVLSNNLLRDSTVEGAFEGIPALRRLYLDRNLLQGVPTDLPSSLEELRLDNNRLSVMSEAAWGRCPGLLVLSLSNNSLGNGSESLPKAVLRPLRSLRTLNLNYNQLVSVPLGLPLSIKEMYLRGNLIQEFRGGAFEGSSLLLILDLSDNRLSNKGLHRESLRNATHLESLNLEGNRLKQVPRHLPPSLKTLNLEGNLITAVKKASFHTLKHLEHLGLARNKIHKVAPGAFKSLPVLHQLDLSHNLLNQVPRQLPSGLNSLVLNHNKIRSVPRDAFCWRDRARTRTLSGLVRVQLEQNMMDLGRLDAQAFSCLRGFQVVHFY